ncbi:hypothetical protein HK099_006077 [Clydaea vesicula]|uniref:mRNA export factor GLE1 n=1 Tax=Clydaea vesicula TaxID=447962 RepID=A0AAD5XX71_9FUNG|nr:hypothetical protein HK099_006077 [Clydaea vesicula]
MGRYSFNTTESEVRTPTQIENLAEIEEFTSNVKLLTIKSPQKLKKFNVDVVNEEKKKKKNKIKPNTFDIGTEKQHSPEFKSALEKKNKILEQDLKLQTQKTLNFLKNLKDRQNNVNSKFEESLKLCLEIENNEKLKVQEKERIQQEEKQKKVLKEKQQQEADRLEKLNKEKLEQEKILHKKMENEKKIQFEKLQAEKLQNDKILALKDEDLNYCSVKANEESTKYLQKILKIKKILKPKLRQNPRFKKVFFDQKREINTRIGQVKNSLKKIQEIISVIDQAFQTAARESPELLEWLMDFTAKALTKQAESEVAVNKPVAKFLGMVAVGIFQKYPNFLEILLGRMMKSCPYIIPRYFKRLPNESGEDFKKRHGYGENEKEDLYVVRMNGVLAFYCGIFVSDGNNIHGIEYSWVWLARLLNMKPRKITASLIQTFLEIAGSRFLEVFQTQGRKLINFIIKDYCILFPSSAIASGSRLKTFLENGYLNDGSLPSILPDLEP